MARFFDGTGDNIDLGTDLYNAQDRGTISAWVNGSDYSDFPIFSMGENSNDSTLEIWFFRVFDFSGTNELQIQCRTPNNSVRATTTPFTNGVPHHVALTSDNSTWKLYVDGGVQSLTIVVGSNNGNWWDHVVTSGAYDYSIGEVTRGTTHAGQANGTIGEVAVYSDVLSDAEIDDLALGKSASRVRPDLLVSHWPLWGKSGTEPDVSGGGRDGTVNNAVSVEHFPVGRFRKRKPRLFFNEVVLTGGVVRKISGFGGIAGLGGIAGQSGGIAG